MSITRLHNTDRLQALLEAQNKKKTESEDLSKLQRETQESKSIAFAADRRSEETARNLIEWGQRLADLDGRMKLFEERYDAINQHLECIEASLIELKDRQSLFDHACEIISEDHAKIDDLLANIHTGMTPRGVPTLDTRSLEISQRTVATDGSVTMTAQEEEKPRAQSAEPARRSVKARVISK